VGNDLDISKILVDRVDGNQPLGRHLLVLFRSFENELLLRLSKQGVSDITTADLQTLHFVRPEGSSATEIGHLAGITKQAVGKAVKSLRERGYLLVKPSPKDGRTRRIVFSARGLRLVTMAIEAIRDIEISYQDAIGAKRFRDLKAALAELISEFPMTVEKR
jgi:DNA-binding MarR family transcriptional regulator